MNGLIVAGVVLLALVVGGVLARRVGQSVIPAYIVVGVLLGPGGLTVPGVTPLVAAPEALRLVADVGVVLLLFFVGLELGLEQLVAAREKFRRAGTIDVGVSLPIGFLLGLALGFSALEAGFLALIVFNSSTVIVAKSVVELGWLTAPESDAIFGVVVIEDVITAALFAVLSALLLGDGDPVTFARSVAVGVAFLGVVTAAAYVGTDPLRRAVDGLDGELFVLVTLGIAALVAGLGLASGTSEAVTAFLVGTGFKKAGLDQRIHRLVTPLRDLFAALFFFVIGAQTDPALLAATAEFVGIAAVVTVGGQLLSGYYAGRAYGLTPERATRMATALAARGEFSLVIAAFLAAAGTTPVLRETIPAFTVGYVLVTSVVGPVLMREADRLDLLRRRVGRLSLSI